MNLYVYLRSDVPVSRRDLPWVLIDYPGETVPVFGQIIDVPDHGERFVTGPYDFPGRVPGVITHPGDWTGDLS